VSADDRGPEELALREGLPYRLADVARSREALVSAWRRAGYLEVKVGSDVVLSEARDEARVSLVVEPGLRTIVEHVVLAGLDRTRDVTVEREMLLRPGEPFSFERVLESQRRLSSLGIFERVQISELDPGRERRRDVVVGVQEAPRTSWSWGVGYSEQDRLRGSVEVTRRNLGGLGRTASAFARGSFRGNRFLLNLREPWLFGRKLDSFLTGFWEEEDRTSFDYNRLGGIVQIGRTLDTRTSLILRYLYQDTNVFNIEGSLDAIDRQYRTYAVSGPSASVLFDTRDDPLEPRRGIFLGADVQLSLDAFGGESYLRSFFQAVRVSRLRSDLVLVLSGRVGLAASFADTPPLLALPALLPLPERFFAGGDYGPRGFPVDGVGPKVLGTDGVLYPTGGNAVLLGGAEMRYNLSRSFQLASFLDTGNVYLEARDVALQDLRWSAGLGVRYRTPIGPIRLDWGYVLDHQPGEARSRFHLSIGHAF
jgi:outer membrane protein insertion porin family